MSLDLLENCPVLATGHVEEWSAHPDEIELLLSRVNVFNYGTGELAAQIGDSCLRIPSDIWQSPEDDNLDAYDRFEAGKDVNFSAKVRRRTRTNGAEGLELRMTSTKPTTVRQQEYQRQFFQSNRGAIAEGNNPENIDTLIGLYVVMLFRRNTFEYEVGDWRDFSDRSLENALTLVNEYIGEIEAASPFLPLLGNVVQASPIAQHLEAALQAKLRI